MSLNKIRDEHSDVFRILQSSPLFFVEYVWDLIPQAPKPEFRNEVLRLLDTELEDWETAKTELHADMFMPFEKGRNITWQQAIFLKSVEKALKHNASSHISVASGHGTGKSSTLSFLLYWYLFCFKNAQIPCTAPTSDQMYDVLWKELALWLARMPENVKKLFMWESSHVRMKESPETWFARAKTASKENPEALAGVHGDFVMMLVDEASGVEDQIFNTAEGALTNAEILVILVSNPTRSEGYFFDTHNSEKMRPDWQNLVLDSTESPIVEPEFEERMAKRHGRGSVEYNIRVKGLFPDIGLADDQNYVPLLSEKDIRVSMDKVQDEYDFTGDRVMGVDPSGEGDDTTELCVRDSFRAAIVDSEKSSNPKSVARKVIKAYTKYGVKPLNAVVENFGVGADVMGEVALGSSNRISTVQTGDLCDDETDKELYINKRAEYYYKLRKWLRAGGEIVDPDGSLKAELLRIKYRRSIGGKIQIMSKKEMKKNKIPSPNKADALMLSFAVEIINQSEDDIETIREINATLGSQVDDLITHYSL